jgi:hypothetical protein
MNEHEEKWRQPPPGTCIVTTGCAQQGDWFYIRQLGAWAPVPSIGWGSPIGGALIARGQLDSSTLEVISTRALAALANASGSETGGEVFK